MLITEEFRFFIHKVDNHKSKNLVGAHRRAPIPRVPSRSSISVRNSPKHPSISVYRRDEEKTPLECSSGFNLSRVDVDFHLQIRERSHLGCTGGIQQNSHFHHAAIEIFAGLIAKHVLAQHL